MKQSTKQFAFVFGLVLLFVFVLVVQVIGSLTGTSAFITWFVDAKAHIETNWILYLILLGLYLVGGYLVAYKAKTSKR
ncbi:MAG: hypothetical protein RBT45_05865 [Acholeplasmataceae bacterium]|jgi:uncharacterized membrane protein YhdT|nr:hypothetical protein [Acholeplasmataceae bacterium]